MEPDRSSGCMAVFLQRMPKTGPSACDPFTMSGARASVSATASAVIIKTMKDFIMSPKLEPFCLIRTDAYQRPSAQEHRDSNCDTPQPNPDMWPRKSACLLGWLSSEANWIDHNNIGRISEERRVVTFLQGPTLGISDGGPSTCRKCGGSEQN